MRRQHAEAGLPFANASCAGTGQQEAACIAFTLNVTRVAHNNVSFGNLEKNKPAV